MLETGNYLDCGVADVVTETGEPALFDALARIWESVALRKMDITGSVVYGQLETERGDRAYEAYFAGHLTFAISRFKKLMAASQQQVAQGLEDISFVLCLAEETTDGSA